jgi:hypothetical protein
MIVNGYNVKNRLMQAKLHDYHSASLLIMLAYNFY